MYMSPLYKDLISNQFTFISISSGSPLIPELQENENIGIHLLQNPPNQIKSETLGFMSMFSLLLILKAITMNALSQIFLSVR